MSENRKNPTGRDFEEGITEGLKSGDWSKLNVAIKSTVDMALDNAGKQISQYGGSVASETAKNLSTYMGAYSEGQHTKERQQKLEAEKRARQAELERRRKAELELRQQKTRELANARKKNEISVPINRIGEYSSTICMVGGGIGMGVSTVGFLSNVPAIIHGNMSLAGMIVMGIVFGASFLLFNRGSISGRRLKLAKRFAALGSKKGYIEIDDVSKSTGRNSKQIVRDFKKMLKMGFFPEGHIDDDSKNLIFKDSVYDQYLETRNYQKSVAKEIIDTTAKVVDDEFGALSEEQATELRQMIAEGNSYIERLHELNDKIPGEVITAKLSRLEALLREIFAGVRVHPEQMSKMHELMEYYLPTMLKLVTAYEEYDRISEPGTDIINAKKDIEDTLDTINEAFKKLLNNLFKDSVWDVTTDAQVLKTVLTQKGLN